jgi:hypothetical protein
MQKILVVLAMTIGTLGIAQASGLADDQQTKQTEQAEMQSNMMSNQVTKDRCSAKTKRDKKQHSQNKHVRSNRPQEESPDPQNVIELRGGG